MSELILNVQQAEMEEMDSEETQPRPKSVAVLLPPLPRSTGGDLAVLQQQHARLQQNCRETEELSSRRSAQLVQINRELLQKKREMEDMERKERERRDRYGRDRREERSSGSDREKREYRDRRRSRTPESRSRLSTASTSRFKPSSSQRQVSSEASNLKVTTSGGKERSIDTGEEVQKGKTSLKPEMKDMVAEEGGFKFELNEEVRFFNYHLEGEKWRFPMGRSGIIVGREKDEEKLPKYTLRDMHIVGLYAKWPENHLSYPKIFYEWLMANKGEEEGAKA